MINKKVEVSLNTQLNHEIFSAYLYLSMSAWLKSENLEGFGHWLKIQYDEEIFHAMKMFNYINDRSGKIVLRAIKAPKTDWKDILELFQDVYNHEQSVSKLINEIADVATAEKDHATLNFIQWYIQEQVEEEANVLGIYKQLQLIEGKGAGLFMLDREAKARAFTPPVDTAL